jgi:hypothetical protein
MSQTMDTTLPSLLIISSKPSMLDSKSNLFVSKALITKISLLFLQSGPAIFLNLTRTKNRCLVFYTKNSDGYRKYVECRNWPWQFNEITRTL